MISVLIRTKNCEDIIDTAIQSVYNVTEEIIIIDDYSKDLTVERCKKWGKVKVFEHKWQDETTQIIFGINHIHGTWILMLDADENLSNKLCEEISHLPFHNYSAFRIPFQVYYLGSRLRYSLGWDGSTVLRLFRKDKIKLPAVSVHSWITVEGEVGFTKGYIIHNRGRNMSTLFRTITHYARWQSMELKQKNSRVSSIIKAAPRFIKVFFDTFQTSKKDGFIGLVFSWEWAMNSLLTYLIAGVRS